MGNVTKLPDRPVREWLVVEKTLREILAESDADQDMADYVCAAMRPVFLKYAAADSDFVLDMSSVPPDEAVRRLNNWVHNLTNGMLLELAIREIELYRLRGGR